MSEEESETRDAELDNAFREGASVVDGLRLRPINVSLIRNVEKLGLTFLQGEIKKLSTPALIRQIAVFAWFQSQDPAACLQHLREGTWEIEVDVFEATLSPEVIKHLLHESERIIRQAEEASFDLQERESASELDGEDAPGNS